MIPTVSQRPIEPLAKQMPEQCGPDHSPLIASSIPTQGGVKPSSFSLNLPGLGTIKKACHIALLCLMGYAASAATIVSAKPVACVSLSKLEGIAWVKKSLEAYPEVLWLADQNVRKTEEGKASLETPYSVQLFGQKYIEFDRTLMTLHCLKLILDGSEKAYQEFTEAQGADVKLTKESFRHLHSDGQRLLSSRWGGLNALQLREAMETALVLGDMGKSEKAREQFKEYAIKAPDHDDFHGEAMQVLLEKAALCPSFARLPEMSKKLLAKVANLAHYGHVTHLEGGLGMFQKLKESGLAERDPVALAFDVFVHTCDVAGALGHVNNRSSIVYSEQAHQAMEGVKAALQTLKDPLKTEIDAYNSYLTLRAGWIGLKAQAPSDRVLARIAAMLRLFTPEEGSILAAAMQKLSPNEQSFISDQLDAGAVEREGRTPTYMPAMLVNLSNNNQLGATKEERLGAAVQLGLPFLSRVLAKHQEMLKLGNANADVPLNFNAAAGVAKSAPEKLKGEFTIEADGSVLVF